MNPCTHRQVRRFAAAALATTGGASTLSSAQSATPPSATPAYQAVMSITADHSTMVVEPGETVPMHLVVTWNVFQFGHGPGLIPAQFAGWKGELEASDDLGSSRLVGSHLAISNSDLTKFGTSVGGSIEGIDIAIIPFHFQPEPWPGSMNWWGLHLINFDWTAPMATTPTQVDFTILPDPTAPSVRLYPTWHSVGWVDAYTGYSGASITVLPAPASLVLPVVAGIMVSARRRRVA